MTINAQMVSRDSLVTGGCRNSDKVCMYVCMMVEGYAFVEMFVWSDLKYFMMMARSGRW